MGGSGECGGERGGERGGEHAARTHAEYDDDFADDFADAVYEAALLDRALHAIAHPVRRYLLELLIYGGEGAGSLAASAASTFGISPSRASQHLQVLAHAGVVDVGTDGPRRDYRLVDGSLDGVVEWIGRLRPGRAAGR